MYLGYGKKAVRYATFGSVVLKNVCNFPITKDKFAQFTMKFS